MYATRFGTAGWTFVAVGALASSVQAGSYGPGPGGLIPDNNPAGLTSVINVSAPGATIYRLNAVTLQFGLPAHSWVGDLHAKLTSPDGRTMHLFSRVGATVVQPGGDSSDLTGSYTFVAALDGPSFFIAAAQTDERATITPGTYARSTHPMPAGIPDGINTTDFADFTGDTASGAWTLQISDWAPGDSGVLTGWTIDLTPQLVVTGLGDGAAPGPAGSLRAALSAANATPGDDHIVFAPTLEGTITLSGGALSITQPVTIQGPGATAVQISGNDVSRVFSVNSPGSVEMNDLTIRDGHAAGGTGNYGGAIYVQSAERFVLRHCTVRDSNLEAITAAYGGGLYLSQVPDTQLHACTFHANRSQAGTATYGGAIAATSGVVLMESCTISGNTSTAGTISFAGGIYTMGTLLLRNCTIASNSAESAGVVVSGTLALRNTIVAGNGGGDVALHGTGSQVISQGNNIIGEATTLIQDGVNGDRTGLDPGLMALGEYGGPTLTHALRPDSPAIDRGTSNATAADQRGRPRGNDANCDRIGGPDIGAFEYNAGPGIFLDGNNDYVSAPGGNMWALTSGFTLEACVQLDSISDPSFGTTRILSTRSDANGGIGFGQTNGRLVFTTFGRQDYNAERAVLPLHGRTHVAVVFDSTYAAHFYVNGEYVESVAGSQPAFPSTTLLIGRNPPADAQLWHGVIEDVRIWTVERTDEEIAGNADRKLRGDEPGLLANWRFEEGAGVFAADTANGYDGFVSGVPIWMGTDCGGCATDLDGDGATAISDLAILLSNFATSGASGADGDLNGDQSVDIADLAVLLASFGTTCD